MYLPLYIFWIFLDEITFMYAVYYVFTYIYINIFSSSRYETVTQTDVENTRHQIRPPIMNMSSSEVIHDLKDQAKNDHTLSSSDAEEHTNGIPHIPNYWTPTHHLKNVISKCIKLNYYFRLRWKFFPSNRFEFK